MTGPLVVFDQTGDSNDFWCDEHGAVVMIGHADGGDRYRIFSRDTFVSGSAPMSLDEARAFVADYCTALGPLARIQTDDGEPIKLASPYNAGPVIWLRVEGGYRLYYSGSKAPIELKVYKHAHEAYNASVAAGFRAWRWAPDVCSPRDMTDQSQGGRTR